MAGSAPQFRLNPSTNSHSRLFMSTSLSTARTARVLTRLSRAFVPYKPSRARVDEAEADART
jgi:hypothetical protein